MSDVASAFLNTLVDESKGSVYVQEPPEIQYPEPTVGDSNVNSTVSKIHRDHGRFV